MMNFRIFKYIYGGMLMIAVVLIGGCKDNIEYNVTGDAINRVYINTQSEYINTFNLSVLHTPLGSTGNVVASFPVQCTQNAAADLAVTFVVDSSLVDVYNMAHSTKYKKVPSGVVVNVSSGLTIPKGGIISADSLTVSIDSLGMSLLTDTLYMVPIRIATISNASNTAISSNLSIVYVIIKTSWTNCYNSPTSVPGTLISPRTAWTATFANDSISRSNTGTAAKGLFDGSTTTYWYLSPVKQFILTVNLATVYSGITGIRINTNSTSYDLTQVDVNTSTDGVNWVFQGNPTLSTANAYQYIEFYSPINAQYIRIGDIKCKSTSRVYLAEFDVY
jgi:hypothetical protein